MGNSDKILFLVALCGSIGIAMSKTECFKHGRRPFNFVVSGMMKRDCPYVNHCVRVVTTEDDGKVWVERRCGNNTRIDEDVCSTKRVDSTEVVTCLCREKFCNGATAVSFAGATCLAVIVASKILFDRVLNP